MAANVENVPADDPAPPPRAAFSRLMRSEFAGALVLVLEARLASLEDTAAPSLPAAALVLAVAPAPRLVPTGV